MTESLTTHLATLAMLMAEAQAVAAPYDAQRLAITIARADALAALTFQIETLQATLRPLLLAEGRTVRSNGLTAVITHKQTWDTEGLLAMAQEVPALLQWRRERPYVSFRIDQTRVRSTHA